MIRLTSAALNWQRQYPSTRYGTIYSIVEELARNIYRPGSRFSEISLNLGFCVSIVGRAKLIQELNILRNNVQNNGNPIMTVITNMNNCNIF